MRYVDGFLERAAEFWVQTAPADLAMLACCLILVSYVGVMMAGAR